jgi:hypothetical protein
MHAHNRTLIAKLGFADPDKGSPLHSRACLWLDTDGSHVLRHFIAKHHNVSKRSIRLWSSDTEVQLADGKKMRMLFADVVVEYGICHQLEQEPYIRGKLGVEVKIDPRSKPDDCKRQIRLYNNSSDIKLWMLATHFRLNEDYREIVTNASLLQLGDEFAEWNDRFSEFNNEYPLDTLEQFDRWVRECNKFQTPKEALEFYARPEIKKLIARIYRRETEANVDEEAREERCLEEEAEYQAWKKRR